MILELSEYQLKIVYSALNFSANQHFSMAMNCIGENNQLFDANLKRQQEYDEVLKFICEQEKTNRLILNSKLHSLREDFKEKGYTIEQIKEIELSKGDGSIEKRIDNLDIAMSYWTN